MPGRFDETVRHQRAGRNDRFDHAALDQIAKNKPIFADRQRAGERHHHETIFVARHRFQHVRGVADLAPGERRVAHRAHQLVDGAAFR